MNTYFCSDRYGGRFYFAVNDNNETIDHGEIVNINGVDKLVSSDATRDKPNLADEVPKSSNPNAPVIFGEYFEDLIDGDLAPEWDGNKDWERVDLATILFITLDLDGIELNRRLRSLGDDSPVLTAGSSPEDEHGQRQRYVTRWAGYFKRLVKVKGKHVYIVGDQLDEMKEIAQYAFNNGARAFLVDNAQLLESLTGNAPGLDVISKEWKGRDEERREQARRILMEADPEQEEDWTRSVRLPQRLGNAVKANSDKYHKPFRSNALAFLVPYAARFGESQRLRYDEGDYYAYLAGIMVGNSGSGKSPIMKAGVKELLARLVKETMEAEGRSKNHNALTSALKKANEKVAKAEQAVAEGVENAEKLREVAERERDEIAVRLKRANNLPYKCIVKYASPSGVKLDLADNAKRARDLDVPLLGTLVWLDEAARILAATQGTNYTLDVFALLSELLDRTFNSGRTSKGDSAADKGDNDLLLAASLLMGIQPGLIRVEQLDAFIKQGFLNRFLWVYLPYSYKADEHNDITDDLAPWYRLFNVKLPPNEYRLGEAAERIFQDWSDNKLQQMKNNARLQRDEATVGFLTKLDDITLRLALVFHLMIESTKIDEGRATLPELIIGADVVRMAIEFAEAMIEEREKTFRLMRSRRVRSQSELSPDAQKVYKFLVGKGWTTVTAVQKEVAAFRDDKRRDAIIVELVDAGLLIVGEHEQKKKLCAIEIEEVEFFKRVA